MISINKNDYRTEKLAVTLLHFNEDGNVLAVSRKNNKSDFGLIGGKVENNDETLLEALKRETKEETGLDILDATPFFVLKESNGFTTVTFIADEIDGDISTTESGVVEYVDVQTICTGSFGDYNAQLLDYYFRKL